MAKRKEVLNWEEIDALVEEGRATLLGHAGLQKRPIYLVDGEIVYEKNIDFGDGKPCFYRVGEPRASELRKALGG